MLRFCIFAVFLLLDACMVGPDYKEPPKPVAPNWKTYDKHIKQNSFRNANWWKVFHDPTLTKLIHLGYQHNISLQSAAAKVMQMRAKLAQSVGQFYPQQQALNGNFTYQRIGGQSLQFVLPSSLDTVLASTTASWELDFWGKYRRSILSNDASFLASYGAYDNALVSLTADIATTYIQIRTTEALIKVIKQNIAVQKEALDIAKARFNAGETNLLDVEESLTVLAQTEATLPTYISQLQKDKDMLGVLLGTTPNHVDGLLLPSYGIPKAPKSVAVGIPKESISRRPDVFQARMQAIAQSEAIGAVKAQLYPSLSLAGTFGFGANNIPPSSLGDIFDWSNRIVSGGPSFTWPILNYGQITNQVRQQDAIFQQSLLTYVDTVLKAQQEVQDNIVQFAEMQKSEGHLIVANKAAVTSTKLAIIRYKEGESDYTPVLNTETQQLKVQTSLVNTQGDVPIALVALFRAIGGGWQIRGCNDIVPVAMKNAMKARTNWGDLLEQPNHRLPNKVSEQTKELYLPNW